MKKQKMKLSKNVFDAIELFLKDNKFSRHDEEIKAIIVAEHCQTDFKDYEDGQYIALNEITTFDLMQCMVNGYETEKTLLDKLKENINRNKQIVEDPLAPRAAAPAHRSQTSAESFARGYLRGADDVVGAFEINTDIIPKEKN